MIKLDCKITIRIDSDLENWLNILEKRYHIKKADFIRKAIVEKMKRDISSLRLKRDSDNNPCPF